MRSFCVTFNTGYYGSWLVWFLSQHRGFAPCAFTPAYNHFNSHEQLADRPIHMRLEGHEWFYEPRECHMQPWSLEDGEDTPIELDEYLDLYADYEKFAYKPVPHFPFDMLNDTAYRNLITKHSDIITVGCFKHKEIIGDRLTEWSWDWVGNDNVYDYVDQTNRQATSLANLTDGLFVDIGALLGPDEDLAHEEYWRLLEFTESPGLNNYRDLLQKVYR